MDEFLRLVEEQYQWLLSQEAAAQQRMVDIYQQSLGEIYQELEMLPQDSFVATRLQYIQVQLETIVTRMGANLTTTLTGAALNMFDEQTNRHLAHWVQLETKLGQPAIAAQFELITPAVPQNTVRIISESARVNIKRLTDNINDAVQKELTQSVVKGESIQKSVRRLRKVVPDTMSTPNQYRANLELISRMEIIGAEQEANSELAAQAQKRFPKMELWQMLFESIDKQAKTRNHYISWAAHGVVRNVSRDENYWIPYADAEKARQEWIKTTKRKVKEGAGVLWGKSSTNIGQVYTGKNPPIHFNDRVVQMPWSPRWPMDLPPKYPRDPEAFKHP